MTGPRKTASVRIPARDRLIVALDVDDRTAAMSIVKELHDHVGMFKIGHQLFTAFGPDIVASVTGLGGRVFLDLKYLDIPNTVAKAAREAVRLGVALFNVHALGGRDMMRAAAESAREAAAVAGSAPPRVLAVTVLTSMDETVLRRELKISRSLPRTVGHFARMAQRAGLDGVVASPLEIRLLRRAIKVPFVILTPGVRPDWAGKDDQKRIMTPGEAVAAGADYIVVGRPILKAGDRLAATQRILEDMSRTEERKAR